MSNFVISMTTDNDAFAGDPAPEVARILRRIADRVEDGNGAGGKYQTIFDINGSDVGRWRLKEGDGP